MPATKISIDKAKPNKLFYVVANVVIYRKEDQRCLILKRSPFEIAHPGKYAVPGGKLEWDDLPLDKPTRVNDNVLDYENAIEELLLREAQEEAGVEIDLSQGLKYINSVAFIRPDGIPVILVKYAAPYKNGEIKLEEKSFTDYAWVTAEEAAQYDCIQGIPEEIALSIKSFQKNQEEN